MEELNAFYEDLLLELECPVCTNYMTPPIRQCATGHSICESCRKNLSQCPLCKMNFTEAKNISLEALARKMHFPCINQSAGCDAKLLLEQKERHEKNCFFKGFRCVMDKCTWAGTKEDILEHWNSKKTKSKTYRSFNTCCTKIESESYHANLVEAYSEIFWFRCKLGGGKIFWAVQFVGHKDGATNYLYEIEIFKPFVSRSKVFFRDYCQSIVTDDTNLFKPCGCITASTDCLENFVDADRCLNYYMRVCQVEDESSDKQTCAKEKLRKIKNTFDKETPLTQSWLRNRFLV